MGGGAVVDEQTVRARFLEAGSRQRRVHASFEGFRDRVVPLLQHAEGSDDVPPERFDDLFLACACAEGDPAALQHFEQHLVPVARAAVCQVSTASDLVDETIQELRQRLFMGDHPRIAAYAGKGPLWKWLRITASRTAHDLLRARGTARESSSDVVERLLMEDVEPEFRLIRERYQDLFREALREAVTRLTAEERTLLRLRYVENQGIDRLAIPFRAHRATIARRLQTIRDKMLAHVQRRLSAEDPRLGEGDAHSLWRAVRSHIHFSFTRILGEGADADRLGK
jgi:RNA polymerase sigma-70 factor (ECF subfamily)